jgi:cell division inhibitor SepF
MALGKLKGLFKNSDGEDEAEEEEYYAVDEKAALKEASSNGNKMILLEPRSFSEAQAIADHLKKRNSVVVNLKRVTSAQAKRIIDFLSGCIYAIGGNMQKIGVGIYLCTPRNVNVQGQITDDNDKVKTGSDDELEW